MVLFCPSVNDFRQNSPHLFPHLSQFCGVVFLPTAPEVFLCAARGFSAKNLFYTEPVLFFLRPPFSLLLPKKMGRARSKRKTLSCRFGRGLRKRSVCGYLLHFIRLAPIDIRKKNCKTAFVGAARLGRWLSNGFCSKPRCRYPVRSPGAESKKEPWEFHDSFKNAIIRPA